VVDCAFQSERFYAALKGQAVPCQLVVLPYESHGYEAYESIMHTLYEQDAWLERYVKNAAPKSQDGNGAAH
jgi:dipeptidyl aminopeptidase/acylaminoacyl peptidase